MAPVESDGVNVGSTPCQLRSTLGACGAAELAARARTFARVLACSLAAAYAAGSPGSRPFGAAFCAGERGPGWRRGRPVVAVIGTPLTLPGGSTCGAVGEADSDTPG